jgi:ABC-type thiamine transport system ATPase subunit
MFVIVSFNMAVQRAYRQGILGSSGPRCSTMVACVAAKYSHQDGFVTDLNVGARHYRYGNEEE